jgi:hypothetical protein
MVRTAIYGFLVGIATLIVTFILTNVLYAVWLGWRYPGEPNSTAGLGAFVLGMLVAPICTVISVSLFVFFRRRTL